MMQKKQCSLGQVAELVSMFVLRHYGVDQLEELVNRCANGTYDAEFVQALIERRLEIIDGCIPGLRRVPALGWEDRALRLNYLDDDWNVRQRILFVRE
jgi:hypothetical protein